MYLGESWPDVLNLVTPEPRDYDPETIWLAVNTDLMYTKSLEHLLGRLRNPNVPDGALAQIFHRAKSLQSDIWHSLQVQGDPRGLPPLFRAIRAEALDVLRLWFTEHLHRMISPTNSRMGLHITPKDLRYKQ